MSESCGGISQVLTIRSYIPSTTSGCNEARELPRTDPAVPGGGQGVPMGAGTQHPALVQSPWGFGGSASQGSWDRGRRCWGSKSQLLQHSRPPKRQKVL